MLNLDDDRWSQLTHAYGKAHDIPELLIRLKSLPKHLDWKSEPYFSLWNSLCHQGDTYTASYAAVPHIYSICEKDMGLAHWSMPQLMVCIEISRLQERGPIIPDHISELYFEAIKKLPSLIVNMQTVSQADELVSVGAASLAVITGAASLAEAYLEMTTEMAPRFLEWVLEI